MRNVLWDCFLLSDSQMNVSFSVIICFNSLSGSALCQLKIIKLMWQTTHDAPLTHPPPPAKKKKSIKVFYGYSIKTYHPGGPHFEIGQTPFRSATICLPPHVRTIFFQYISPFRRDFYIFQDGFSYMYVCM